MTKFPFFSYKKSELPHVAQELSEREKFKRMEHNPTMFRGFETSRTYQHPNLFHMTASRAPRQSSDPTPALKRQIYEQRQFDREKKDALRQASKPNLAESEFLNHFEEFNRTMTHFRSNGKGWPKPQGLVLRLKEVTAIKSQDEWLNWILSVKTKNGSDYNWFHPDWSNGILRDQFNMMTEVEKVRLKSYSNTFLEFTMCQQHRHKVSYAQKFILINRSYIIIIPRIIF